MKKYFEKFNKKYPPSMRQGGQAMLISIIFFLFISIAIIFGLVSPAVREYKVVRDSLKSKQGFFLAESAIEDSYYRLKVGKSIGSTNTVTLLGSSATATIEDSGYNEKTIRALGDVSGRQRTAQLVLGTGDGVSFNYGIQSGTGGFILGNAVINGNVYSNGTILGSNGATVTGSAFSVGASGLIDNVSVGADARAHTVTDSVVAGNLYCQTGTANNKACNTSLPDPTPAGMPISDEMIAEWKSDAELGGTHSGDLIIATPSSLGPKKITGNLAINSNLVITGTIYVMGNITTSNNAQVSLDGSYGPTGGIIVTDGRVTLSNNVAFFGSGQEGSYVLLATTSQCPVGCAGQNALEVLNNVGAILVNAQNGTVHLNNNVELSEVVGKTIIVDNNAEVNYTLGLANAAFTSGPAGGWTVKSWQEVK